MWSGRLRVSLAGLALCLVLSPQAVAAEPEPAGKPGAGTGGGEVIWRWNWLVITTPSEEILQGSSPVQPPSRKTPAPTPAATDSSSGGTATPPGPEKDLRPEFLPSWLTVTPPAPDILTGHPQNQSLPPPARPAAPPAPAFAPAAVPAVPPAIPPASVTPPALPLSETKPPPVTSGHSSPSQRPARTSSPSSSQAGPKPVSPAAAPSGKHPAAVPSAAPAPSSPPAALSTPPAAPATPPAAPATEGAAAGTEPPLASVPPAASSSAEIAAQIVLLRAQLPPPDPGLRWVIFGNAIFQQPDRWHSEMHGHQFETIPLSVYSAAPPAATSAAGSSVPAPAGGTGGTAPAPAAPASVTPASDLPLPAARLTVEAFAPVHGSLPQRTPDSFARHLIQNLLQGRPTSDLLQLTHGMQGPVHLVTVRLREPASAGQPAAIVHKLFVIAPPGDSLHVISFAAAREDWPEAWARIGAPLFARITLSPVLPVH